METAGPGAVRGGGAHVLFTLAGGTYALPSDVVLQLALPGDVTPVPNAPPWVDGVTSIRGRVTPVVDLRTRFGFPRVPPDRRSRLVVVAVAGREVALRVDAAREFATLEAGTIEPVHGALERLGDGFVRGTTHLAERVVMVLDVETLLSSGPPAPSRES